MAIHFPPIEVGPLAVMALMEMADEVDAGDVVNLGDALSWGHLCHRHAWVSLPAHSPDQARKNTCPECDGEREGLAGRSRFQALRG